MNATLNKLYSKTWYYNYENHFEKIAQQKIDSILNVVFSGKTS